VANTLCTQDAARSNLDAAFHKAKALLDIPLLLEPDDLLNSDPDEKSIMVRTPFLCSWLVADSLTCVTAIDLRIVLSTLAYRTRNYGN
jgi:hypothetical protein